MTKIIELFFLPFFVGFIVSYFVTFLVIKFAKKLKIIDDPKKSNHPKVIHTVPTPRGGGIPIFISLVIASLIFIPIDKHLASILLGALIVFIMGYLDDIYDLNPYLRLAGGALAAAIPISAGIGISFLTNPFGGIIDLSNPILSDLFALFWIVFMMNMVNMGAKGIDGQLSGVIVIAALTITGLSFYYSSDITQWPVILISAITAGAFLGFLIWHKFPQKIMPGYGGSTLAGYLLAIASILSTTKVGTLIVVLGIPLIDTGYVIVRRILSGKSPIWGDRSHLHHRLLDYGFSKKQVSQIYWSLTAILGILALNLNSTYKLYTIVGVGLGFGRIDFIPNKEKTMFDLVVQIIRVLRPVHWIKNLALFGALFLTGAFFETNLFKNVFIAFIAFSFATSAAYIFNDILDANSDKIHPIKKFRPIASGKLPLRIAFLELLTLTILSLIIAVLLNQLFFTLIVVYLIMQILYSIGLKNIPVVDILIIATGFILRVYAGAFVIDAHLSVWFLLCVVSASLFLAAGKRRSEINLLKTSGGETRRSLAKYSEELLNSYVTMFGNATWMSWSLYTFFESPKASLDFWLILTEVSKTTTIDKLMMLTVPIVIFGVMRYEALIFEGKSEAPEKLLLTDKSLIIALSLLLVIVYWLLYSGVTINRA